MTGVRKEDEDTVFLTGATGFLGSHIMAGLLLKGKNVVIAGRSSRSEAFKERIKKLLIWFGIKDLEGLLEFYEIDFLKIRLGLGVHEYENLCKRHLKILHCAADTSFAEKSRERIIQSNVECLKELLDFAKNSQTPRFHYISSAYAAGKDRIECREAPVVSTDFNNVYEESKARAEGLISHICREFNIPYTIIRPSIVYGDSVTGKSLKFNALYFPIKSLKAVRDIYLGDIKKNKGVKAAETGIYINHEGKLHLPIRIFIPNDGKINLIPVDYFTKSVLSIIEKKETEPYYHITNNNPQSFERLLSYTERFLNINGIKVLIGDSGAHEMRNPPEELFDHFIKPYLPYISDNRIFIRENADRVACGALPPDFSYEIFQKCMAFAVSADWGKRLFN